MNFDYTPKVQALRDKLLPMATVLTPNLPEAEALAGFPVRVEADMARAAERLAALGAKAVLVKGGHLEGERLIDLLFHDGKIDRFEGPRLPEKRREPVFEKLPKPREARSDRAVAQRRRAARIFAIVEN